MYLFFQREAQEREQAEQLRLQQIQKEADDEKEVRTLWLMFRVKQSFPT